MKKRINYYKDLVADYSKPGLISEEMKAQLIQKAWDFITLKESVLPQIGSDYTSEQIEKEIRNGGRLTVKH